MSRNIAPPPPASDASHLCWVWPLFHLLLHGLALLTWGRCGCAVLIDHAAEHPDVKSRRRTEAEVLREFLLGFERQANAQGAVTLPQFERYFSMLSRTIDDDEYFATMMRHAWGVAESY
eukprot:COSAG01_NODE_2836_length_6993_cov_9.416304_4_plen_119_part_00